MLDNIIFIVEHIPTGNYGTYKPEVKIRPIIGHILFFFVWIFENIKEKLRCA